MLSAGPRLFKRSIAQLVFLILIHWVVIYMVDGAIQCLNIRDQINLYPVDNTTLLISLLFISWIVIGLVDSTIQPSKLKSLLGHHLATNPFGLGRLFYKSIRQLQNLRRHGDQDGCNLEGCYPMFWHPGPVEECQIYLEGRREVSREVFMSLSSTRYTRGTESKINFLIQASSGNLINILAHQMA